MTSSINTKKTEADLKAARREFNTSLACMLEALHKQCPKSPKCKFAYSMIQRLNQMDLAHPIFWDQASPFFKRNLRGILLHDESIFRSESTLLAEIDGAFIISDPTFTAEKKDQFVWNELCIMAEKMYPDELNALFDSDSDVIQFYKKHEVLLSTPSAFKEATSVVVVKDPETTASLATSSSCSLMSSSSIASTSVTMAVTETSSSCSMSSSSITSVSSTDESVKSTTASTAAVVAESTTTESSSTAKVTPPSTMDTSYLQSLFTSMLQANLPSSSSTTVTTTTSSSSTTTSEAAVSPFGSMVNEPMEQLLSGNLRELLENSVRYIQDHPTDQNSQTSVASKVLSVDPAANPLQSGMGMMVSLKSFVQGLIGEMMQETGSSTTSSASSVSVLLSSVASSSESSSATTVSSSSSTSSSTTATTIEKPPKKPGYATTFCVNQHMKYMVLNIFPVLAKYSDRDPLKSFFPKVQQYYQDFVTESKNIMTVKYATYFAEWMQDSTWVAKLKQHDLKALEERPEIQACYIPQIMSQCFQTTAREDAWGYIDNLIRSMEWKSGEHQDQLDEVTGIALELMQNIKDQKQNIHSVQDVQGIMNKILQKMQTNDVIRAQLKNLFRNLDNKTAMDSLVTFLGKLDPSNGKSQASIATKEVLEKIQEGMNPTAPSS